jgi:pyruvate dehydrogenase E1 component
LAYSDPDPDETQEWLDSVDALIAGEGSERASQLLQRVVARARSRGVSLGTPVTTDYRNTIGAESEPSFPGDEALEARIRHFVRWNAAVMVARANRRADGIGGHLATYASAATLYEVGFNHFFRGKTEKSMGDQVFFQGHAAPGVYARAFLEGRLA